MSNKSSSVWNEFPGARPTSTKLAPVLAGEGLASDENPGNIHVRMPVPNSASLTLIVAGEARCVQGLAGKESPR
jgi:hypothetical protein